LFDSSIEPNHANEAVVFIDKLLYGGNWFDLGHDFEPDS
jgi:hypothetical protein